MVKKKKKIGEVEYDPSLTQFLADSGFTYPGSFADLCPPPYSRAWYGHRNSAKEIIQSCKESYQIGCIFTIPDDTVSSAVCIFYSTYSSAEIRRIVRMKAFL